MLSSDKNIETIGQLIEQLKHYLGHQSEYMKLDLIDKVVRLLTVTALVVLLFLILLAVLLFAALGFAVWLSKFTGLAAALFIIGGIHLLLFGVVYTFRKTWIERPIVRFLANLLMS